MLSGGERSPEFDVTVVGAGMGGVYALHRLREAGFKVLGLEGGRGVGGVWLHNAYPGARVDIDSTDYCYYFSPEIYREWTWSERYASQPELLRYINFVADRLDIKRLIRFETWLDQAQWRPELSAWELSTSTGQHITSRFLVMATGNLSAPRKPSFPGLETFQGDWVQTSRWPDREVAFKGRRVAVIGTGSSGVQSVPVIAREAEHLFVFQRTPNFSVPAQNGPLDQDYYSGLKARVEEARRELFASVGASHFMMIGKPAAEHSPAERLQMLEAQWARGGHGMTFVFGDQGRDAEVNAIVAEFVRDKIRSIVMDPQLAETLCPKDHPIGCRRMCLDIGYYETFNRPNVSLVDISQDPIERITETGLATRERAFDVDVIVFALGFHAFFGALERANIRNARGEVLTDHWRRGPQTYLGVATAGFPNCFILTGPGSPSVLSNMFLMNEYHADWVADCLRYMTDNGFATVEATRDAQDSWTAHVSDVAGPLLRFRVRNYMVHRNEDGSAAFMPYSGGFGRYAKFADEVAQDGYRGFAFA
jgi:cation diffusion facilitator CzcD-associated flavoprotein CzcO